MNSSNPLRLLIPFCAVVTLWSLISPSDYWVWLFEIIPGLIGITVLAFTYRRFPFSNLIYILVGAHFLILAVAAKYTYAEMPVFNWLKATLELERNNYDRVGHFFQGFVPAIITREFLLRMTDLKRGKILTFLCISVCLAISAFWELLEWQIVIIFYKEQGQQWLGTQGDIWDAQWDMFMALLGASLSILLLSRLHNRSMEAANAAV